MRRLDPEPGVVVALGCRASRRAVGARDRDNRRQPGRGGQLDRPPGGVLFRGSGGATDASFSEPQYQLGARYTSTGGTDGTDTNDMFLSMMNYWDLSGSPDFRAMLGVDSVVVFTCGVAPTRVAWTGMAHLGLTRSVAPRLDLNLLDDPRDVGRLVEEASVAAPRWRKTTPWRNSWAAPFSSGDLADDEAVEAYVRAVVAPWYHPVGTCRMGPDDDAGCRRRRPSQGARDRQPAGGGRLDHAAKSPVLRPT